MAQVVRGAGDEAKAVGALLAAPVPQSDQGSQAQGLDPCAHGGADVMVGLFKRLAV